ncbi:MAG: 50S ribosomal protein L11 methyltransferase [Vibrionaceae bacterium]
MPWIQLKVNATQAGAEEIGDLLLEQGGALTITFLDAKDTPIFEPLPGETRLWGETDVVALFEADVDLTPVIALLKESPLLSADFAYKIEQVEDKDWQRAWMDNFKPMRFGQRLWVCPSWCEVPDPDAVNIMLDPGLAFGTGTHPTTSLCLQWLDSLDLKDKIVVDFGCGSGILSLAALLLGAKQVIGIDIDPQALQASKDNAQRNQVDDRLQLYLPKDQPTNLKADVVVANILAQPLRELAPIIKSFLAEGGQLAMSGVLEEQAQSVADCYRDTLTIDDICVQDEWCRITASN